VSAIHRGGASCCFQFLGFIYKVTTLQSVIGVALYVAFYVMVR